MPPTTDIARGPQILAPTGITSPPSLTSMARGDVRLHEQVAVRPREQFSEELLGFDDTRLELDVCVVLRRRLEARGPRQHLRLGHQHVEFFADLSGNELRVLASFFAR